MNFRHFAPALLLASLTLGASASHADGLRFLMPVSSLNRRWPSVLV